MSRGFTLIEAAVAMAIVALAAISLVPVLNASSRETARAQDAAHAALSVYAASLARDAAQAWKYGAPAGIAPQRYGTTVSGGGLQTPLAVNVTQTVSAIDSASAEITVTVSTANDSASASAVAAALAPLPGSQVTRPGLVPMPTATP